MTHVLALSLRRLICIIPIEWVGPMGARDPTNWIFVDKISVDNLAVGDVGGWRVEFCAAGVDPKKSGPF